MTTKLEEVGKLKEGRYIVLDDHPCKVKRMQTSAPGKHGHAKARISAVSLFDGSKHSTIKPTDARVTVPILDKRKGQVLSVSDKSVQLMDLESYETFDIDKPKKIGLDLESGDSVVYWEVMGRKMLKRKE